MADQPHRTERMMASVDHVFSWLDTGTWSRHRFDPGIADFTVGNPQEMPLPGLVDALQRHAEPKDKDWFAYKFNEPEPRPSSPTPCGGGPASPSSPRTSR